MRKLAIAVALASTAVATPALARDGSGYIEADFGPMIAEDLSLDYNDGTLNIPGGARVDHKIGWDVGLVGGYDFGLLRAEGELAYKRAALDELSLDPRISGINDNLGFDLDGHASVLSGMINVLLDFGDENGWSGFVGPGIGIARVKYSLDAPDADFNASSSDSGIAWQVVAGVRKSLSPNMDLGLKYRFFNVNNLQLGDSDFDLDGRWRSHSLMLSLTYNFAAPPPPPPPPPPPTPPPPPPPATQTCPDGSVILATDVCPAPPPPPPPPPPAPERG
jgi:opacity protein-like surface antigen